VTRIRARLSAERGWGLVSAILVVSILLSLSLPLLSLVDVQQNQSANERKSESSFNLAEAALDASMFVLGKDWPALGTGAYPATCSSTSTSLNCPSPSLLSSTYSGGDYRNAVWTVTVRDDTGTEYYDPNVVPTRPCQGSQVAPCTWDANHNQKVWVRADADSDTGTRTVVALVKRIDRVIPFPRNAVTAGWFTVATNGNKVVVDTKGDTAQAAPVAVRCNAPAPSRCLDYDPNRPHVTPDTTTTGYGGTTVISPDILESMRAKARALDTYYPTCPASPAGEMVFVEVGDCSYSGGGSVNSASAPGVFIVGRGTIAFGGGISFYGLAYAANLQQSTSTVVRVFGSATIVGSIAADGGGGVTFGSSGVNVFYADTIWPNLTSFSGAAPVQGSWRELPAS
jgi:type II secretory pathway pseudopilin PulG